MQAYLNATNDGSTSSTTYVPGHGTVHAGANSNGDIPAVVNEWMYFRIHVDCDLDVAELFYRSETTQPEEISIVSWQWSLDSFGENVVGRKMDAMDFYAPHTTLGCYYLDNFRYTRIGQETAAALEFDTEEINVELMEDEMTSVDINISNATGTSIGDWIAWIDFGDGVDNSNMTQINYDAEIGETSSLVGINVETPTLVEVGAMYPGVAYAGSVMGTKIVSAQYVFFTNSETGTIGIEPNTPVTFRIYQQGKNGQPGELLAEKTISYNAVVADDWTIATFDTPVALTGFNVWVTVEYTQSVSGYAMSFDGTQAVEHGDYYRTNGGGAFSKCSDVFSTNYGNFHIRMNCQGSPALATWASLNKSEGSIAIGGSDELTVTLNSIGLGDGDDQEAEIVFLTNDPNNTMVIIPLNLTIDITSVDENAVKLAEIYPNPATTSVTLTGDNLSNVAIYNVAGQLVRIVKLDSVVNNIEMDVEAGVYFFSVYDNNGRNSVQRVVIVK